MRTIRSAAIALLAALILTGCGSQEGETVFTAGPGNEDVQGKAPKSGTYTLYTAMSPNPTTTVKLNQGDPMGFRKTAEGQIEAFAGESTHKFNKGTSQVYWKYVGE